MPNSLIISITGTDSPETISVAAHVYAVCFKCEHNRNIGNSRSTFSCQTSRCCSCGIILHQIGHAILCSIAACSTYSTPVCFIGKFYSYIYCFFSDPFIRCSTWFAILISIYNLIVHIGVHIGVHIDVTTTGVHRPCTAVYNRGKQPQSLGRGYSNIQASTCFAYLNVICSCCQSRNGIVFIRVIYSASFRTGIAIQYTTNIWIAIKIISTV